jgi:hypothetical protein
MNLESIFVNGCVLSIDCMYAFKIKNWSLRVISPPVACSSPTGGRHTQTRDPICVSNNSCLSDLCYKTNKNFHLGQLGFSSSGSEGIS